MHKHFCPFCEQHFDCPASFCEGVNPMACDSCFNRDSQMAQLTDKLKQITDYAREREQAAA